MVKNRYPSYPILIVDDEPITLETLSYQLHSKGMTNVITCNDPRQVMGVLASREIGVIVLDLIMPYMSGEKLIPRITQFYPEVPIVVNTGVDELETAVRCMRYKAYDYIVKGDKDRLIATVTRAIEFREMRKEIRALKQRVLSDTLNHPEAFAPIITQNKAMFAIFRYIEAVARSSQPVLITGETGVGKEMIAQAIHKCSGRKGEFVPVGIGGLDVGVFSDTLFGHVRGAFTDARSSRPGLVEKAAAGTLFLDEIGDLNLESQIKLLRLIQEREYLPLGTDITRRVNVRIVAATHRNLEKMVEEGRFRNDLYFRLNSHHVNVPPLRRRLEDLPMLLDHFLDMAARELGKTKPTPPKELVTLLATYHFPGNVRELKSMVFDAVANHRSRMLNMTRFRKYIHKSRESGYPTYDQISGEFTTLLSEVRCLPTIRQITRMLVREAMKRSENNRTIAAQMLGITRQTLAKHLKK